VKLRPIDSPELIQLVTGWLSQNQIRQWLEFGDGRQVLTPAVLKVMIQRDTHLLRVFTTDEDDIPIGVVGLTDINRYFKTARIWVALGDPTSAKRGYATRATSAMLTVAFRELGLHTVTTWVVEGNPSQKIAERVGFRLIGRQRRCHWMDGRVWDRLWYDILESEHQE
jgi:RimJ/RimL family protein N-acetyltransferase